MGRKLQISVVTVVLAGIIGALLLYLWDAGNKDRIADGVRIAGVDVGGLESTAAASQIRANLIRPLEKNVVVTHDDERFKLRPEEINVRANVNGMVSEALEASRDGGLLARTVRRIGGGDVDHSVEPTISYSKSSVSEFVDGVAANVGRDPVDASIEPSGASIEPIASKTGLQVDTAKLRKDVERALQDPDDRRIEAEVSKVQPEVRTEDLASQYPSYITVDRSNFRLRLYENLELAKEYTVAIGAVGFDTPSGLYHIQNKAVDPTWNVPDSDWAGKLAGKTIPPGPDNPLKARWMGIYDGAGIHGTDDVGSLGSAASHGCIRMSVFDVKQLYDRVPTGTPIYIA